MENKQVPHLNEEQIKVLKGLISEAVSKTIYDYLEGLPKEEAPITVRPQLTYSQASGIMVKAKIACARQPSLRLGQAIFNALPPEIYKSYTGTDLDFFYWEDNHKVRETFWREYVSNDLYLEYASYDQVR